jgi:NADH:ubiquinone oxidoreductase subunit
MAGCTTPGTNRRARPLLHKTWEKPHLPNLTGTARAYAPAGSIRRAEPEERRDYEAWSPE